MPSVDTDPAVAASAGLPDISLRQLGYLVAVADAPTWAAAAAAVGVSASALSQGLAELERRVGVVLFQTVGRRRLLRPEAQPVLDHARQVVALTHDLVDWSERMRTGRLGRVRVGMIDIAAVVHFPDVLQGLRRDRPDVDLALTVAPSSALLDDLRDGRLDLVVCVEPPSPLAGLELEPLFDEPLAVIGPAGADAGSPGGWGPWLLFPAGSHTRHRVEAELTERGLPIRVDAESHQPDVLVQMVALGLGWSVLPARQVGDRSDVVVGPDLIRRRLALATRSGAVRDPAVDDIADRLRAVPGDLATFGS